MKIADYLCSVIDCPGCERKRAMLTDFANEIEKQVQDVAFKHGDIAEVFRKIRGE